MGKLAAVGRELKGKKFSLAVTYVNTKLRKKLHWKSPWLPDMKTMFVKNENKNFPTFMDLLKHISNHPAQKPSEEALQGILDKEFQDEQLEEKEVVDTEVHVLLVHASSWC